MLASHLLVYVFAFAGLSLNTIPDAVIFLLFFLLMIAIQIRSEMLYINPLLAIRGFRVYEATLEDRVIMLISKGPLEERLNTNKIESESEREMNLIPMGSTTYITPVDDE
jgi:hypothetical protein